MSTSDGTLIDGYLAGATVYIDANNNGKFDPGEPMTKTDGQGDFKFISLVTGPIRAFGGTNIDTGLANTLEFSAPSGSTVVTPLTTLIQELVDVGKTAAEAEAAVEQAFGLDSLGLDLTHLDPIAAAGAGGPTGLAALEVQKAAAAVAEVLDTVADEGGNADGALNALAGLVGDGGVVDLTSSAVLTEIIIAGGIPGSTPEEIQQLVEETQAVTEAIDEATDLGDITDVQGNTAPVAVADSFDVNEDVVGFTSTVSVLANDDDADNDAISVSTVNGQAIAGSTVGQGTVVQGKFGALTIAADGNFSYAANGDILDAYAPGKHLTEVFDYAIGDGNGGIASSTLTFDITTIADTVSAQRRQWQHQRDRDRRGRHRERQQWQQYAQGPRRGRPDLRRQRQ